MKFSHFTRLIVVASCFPYLLSCGVRHDSDVHAQSENSTKEVPLGTLAPLIKVIEETPPFSGISQGTPEDKRRDEAFGKLWEYGPRAKQAVPEIIRVIIKRQHYSTLLPKLLERLDGKNALKAYFSATVDVLEKSEEAERRRRAAEHLKFIDFEVLEPKAVITALMKATIDDADIEVRKQAAWTLREVYQNQIVRRDIGAERFAEFFVALLKDAEADIRGAGAWGLEGMGGDAAPAIMPLLDVINDPEIQVRLASIQALGGIGPPAKQANSVLVKLLNEKEFRIRWMAAQALGKIRPPYKPTVIALVRALDDSNKYSRKSVAKALGNYGADAKVSIPKLIILVNPRLCRGDSNSLTIPQYYNLGWQDDSEHQS